MALFKSNTKYQLNERIDRYDILELLAKLDSIEINIRNMKDRMTKGNIKLIDVVCSLGVASYRIENIIKVLETEINERKETTPEI